MAKSDYQHIKIIVKKPLSKEKKEQMTKELSEFLSKTWQMPLGKSKA